MSVDIRIGDLPRGDARDWARAFMALVRPESITEELMAGWFANAIMCGYDRAREGFDGR